jgi:putative transposase
LNGVKLVTSDSHGGLKNAIAAVLVGSSWQRCRTHFMRNALALVPKGAQQMVAATIRTVFVQPDPSSARELDFARRPSIAVAHAHAGAPAIR